MKPWYVRLPLTIAFAALMGWVGLYLLFVGGPWFPSLNEPITLWVIAASILIWTSLGLSLGRRDLVTWLGWGLLSPLLGCVIVYPPASFAFIIVKGYTSFPVGASMGLLIWWVNRDSRRAELVVRL